MNSLGFLPAIIFSSLINSYHVCYITWQIKVITIISNILSDDWPHPNQLLLDLAVLPKYLNCSPSI